MPPARQQTPFQQTHIVTFGLKIVDRDLNTHIVTLFVANSASFTVVRSAVSNKFVNVKRQQQSKPGVAVFAAICINIIIVNNIPVFGRHIRFSRMMKKSPFSKIRHPSMPRSLISLIMNPVQTVPWSSLSMRLLLTSSFARCISDLQRNIVTWAQGKHEQWNCSQRTSSLATMKSRSQTKCNFSFVSAKLVKETPFDKLWVTCYRWKQLQVSLELETSMKPL